MYYSFAVFYQCHQDGKEVFRFHRNIESVSEQGALMEHGEARQAAEAQDQHWFLRRIGHPMPMPFMVTFQVGPVYQHRLVDTLIKK